MVNPDAVRQQIDIRLEQLRSRSYADLLTLQPFSIEEVPFGTEVWSVTTYRDLEKDAVRIVVQIGPPQPKFLLVRVQADGFRMKRDSTITPLSERELYEFM